MIQYYFNVSNYNTYIEEYNLYIFRRHFNNYFELLDQKKKQIVYKVNDKDRFNVTLTSKTIIVRT